MNRPLALVAVLAFLAGVLSFVGTLVSAPEAYNAATFGSDVRRLASEHKWARVSARARAAARNSPRDQQVLLFWGLGDERSGNAERAQEAWERLLRVTSENRENGNLGRDQLYYRGWALRGLGDESGALEAWKEHAQRSRGETRYNRACYLALAGQEQEAIGAWEELAVSDEWFDAAWARVDPDLDSIRDEPRFQSAMAWSEERMRRQAEDRTPR